MGNPLQFEAFKPSHPECRQCEELLADAVDEVLSPAEQTFFDRHVATCADCMAALADARRGAAWLEMLKTPRPEPSAQLLERILAATSGAALQDVASSPAVTELPALKPTAPSYPPGVLPFRPRLPRLPQFTPQLSALNRLLFEPRLALTAAMAFFSIALTLNLAGVKLNQLHADDLGPSGIRRSYYQATASVARRYEGLRVVHTLESQVNDLRETDQDESSVPGRGAADESDRPTSRQTPPARRAPEPEGPPAPAHKQGQTQDGGVSRQLAPHGRPRLLPVSDRRPTSMPPAALTHKEGGLA